MSGRIAMCAGCLLTAAMLGACAPPQAEEPGSGRLEVSVGLPPLAYLVERVGGDHVAVRVLLPPGQDPHTFEFTPRQVSALARSQLLFKVGMPFEDRIEEKIAGNPGGPVVVDVTQGITKRPMDADGDGPGADHEANGHHHGRGDPDPHVWLSPPLLRIQAGNIAAALQHADPAHAADYRQNLATLLQELDAAHAKIAEALEPCHSQTFFVFHPAFGYFAEAYGLRQKAVEAAGKAPTPKQLQALIQKATNDHVKVIFVQPQFDQRTAKVVADAIGGAVVPIDALAKDVVNNLIDVALKIRESLACRTSR